MSNGQIQPPSQEPRLAPFPTVAFINTGVSLCVSLGLLVTSFVVPWQRPLQCAAAAVTTLVAVIAIAGWNLYGSKKARAKALAETTHDRAFQMLLAFLGGIVGAGASALAAMLF